MNLPTRPVTRTVDDLTWWFDTVPTLGWSFAKTMAYAPHSYIVRGQDLPDDEFDRAEQVIRRFGRPGRFGRTIKIYLHDGDRRWWAEYDREGLPIVINSATGSLEDYAPQDVPNTTSAHESVYDALAKVYDDRYTRPSDLSENADLSRLVVKHFGAYAPTTLDVGCGTGLVLDLGITSPALYTGVDPSQGMLNELVLKHPKVSDLVPGTMAEAVPVLAEQGIEHQFELVTCLFAGSYLTEQEILAMADVVAPGGLILITTYSDGYLPDYHEGTPPETHADAQRVCARLLDSLSGYRSRVGNHDVWVVTA